MTWKAGRQLKTLTKNSVTSTYTYDADGMRTKKQAGNSVTEYIISGDGIAALKSGSYGVYFMRDENGVPYGLRYTTSEGSNFTDYYYQYNLQGDIVSILDSTGNTVAKYTYDPWGYIVSITDGEGNNIAGNANHIANINPLRYRGYMYDTETGLYYLQSRYYDPVTGRFINADDPEILAKDQDNVLQYNLFAYCLNNPVSMHDPDGYAAANIIGGIVGGVTGAALGYLLADALGLKGWKRAALISAATAGGAVLGAFLGPYVAKLGGKVAAKLGIKTVAKQTIKMSSSKLWKGSAKHIFSKDHIRNGIMRLGGSQKTIFNKIYKVVNSNLANAVNGSNQIHTTINGVKTTIRFYVSNGEVQNINAMTGWATRIIGKLL